MPRLLALPAYYFVLALCAVVTLLQALCALFTVIWLTSIDYHGSILPNDHRSWEMGLHICDGQDAVSRLTVCETAFIPQPLSVKVANCASLKGYGPGDLAIID